MTFLEDPSRLSPHPFPLGFVFAIQGALGRVPHSTPSLVKIVSNGLFLACCGSALAVGANASPAGPTWEWGEFSFLGGVFEAHPKINVMIGTELTNSGRMAPDATLAHPVYYSGADGGLTTGGDPIGGERPPKPAELADLMVKSLHSGGYLPASPGHPPTIYIYYSWGSFNELRDGPREHVDPRDYLGYRNLMARAVLVGGTKFAKEWDEAVFFNSFDRFKGTSARNSFLVATALDNLYFLVATACDYQAAARGQVVILWQTRLSTDARVVSMAESLPQMVASAGSYIGHDTNGPVRLNRPAIMEGDVEVGVPFEVRDDLASDAPNPFPHTRTFLRRGLSTTAN